MLFVVTKTTLSFRVVPPLYDLQGATFTVRKVAEFDEIQVKATLVDSGAPILVTAQGTGIRMPGNLGILHNTRLDVTIPGLVDDWMGVAKQTDIRLARVANRLIDWYRLIAQRPSIRRIPLSSVAGCEARDDEGHIGVSLLGWTPGDPSGSGGTASEELVAALRAPLAGGAELPLWWALYLDARAEFEAGELRAAVLLSNSAMETLINSAFRAVASADDVDAAFANESPTSFWRLLKKVNELAGTGLGNKQLTNLAKSVNKYRNDVSHGNPVTIEPEEVSKAVEDLRALTATLDTAVAAHLAQRRGGAGSDTGAPYVVSISVTPSASRS
jgi:hypothetical protein